MAKINLKETLREVQATARSIFPLVNERLFVRLRVFEVNQQSNGQGCSWPFAFLSWDNSLNTRNRYDKELLFIALGTA